MGASLYVACLLLILAAVLAEQPAVKIKQGRLAGKSFKSGLTKRDYNSFKGIPYAEPPIGKLRFMQPKPHKGWDGTRDATKHGSECVQIDVNHEEKPHGSEDCLFLNVYTPYLKKQLPDPKQPLPVLFFIHGNFFHSGSGNADFYGPGFFMEEDVVLVTINYRLGALGFLDLEDDVIAGNMGLKDMAMALKWVKDNIAEFGGDPDTVTIFGQGAGGVAVDLLLLSPLTEGLFKRAIMQSGVSLMSSYLEWGRLNRAVKLAKLFGQDSERTRDMEKTFREMEALDYPVNQTRTVGVDETKEKQIGIVPFSASISLNGDHSFITQFPEKIFESGVIPKPDVSLMIGFTSQESIYGHRYFVQRPPFLRQFNKRFQYLLPLRKFYAKYKEYYDYEIAYRIKQFYFTNGTLDPDVNGMEEFLTWQSDLTVYPVDLTVKSYLNCSKAPVYYYRFSYEGGFNYFKSISTQGLLSGYDTIRVDGASERDELCYMFRCGKIGSQYAKLNETSSDALTIKRLVRLWANFAKTGNPTPDNDEVLDELQWKPAEKESINYLDIGRELKTGTDPHKKSIEFWDAMYEHYSPLAKHRVLYKPEEKDEL